MKKTMTKRLLALVLALAFCTAMMLPGFAATAPKDEGIEPQYIHDRQFLANNYDYYNRAGQGHYERVVAVYWCKRCQQNEFEEVSYTLKPHSGNPCVCGYTGN